MSILDGFCDVFYLPVFYHIFWLEKKQGAEGQKGAALATSREANGNSTDLSVLGLLGFGSNTSPTYHRWSFMFSDFSFSQEVVFGI